MIRRLTPGMWSIDMMTGIKVPGQRGQLFLMEHPVSRVVVNLKIIVLPYQPANIYKKYGDCVAN